MRNDKKFLCVSKRAFVWQVFGLVGSALVVHTRSAGAHHGWSSFDDASPIYLEGIIKSVRWQNPHAELIVEVATGFAMPGNLASRIPAQQASIDAAGIVSKTKSPNPATNASANTKGGWEVELAPLQRMNAWQMSAPAVGSKIALIGYTFADQKPDSKGTHILRAEFVFVGDKTYALRSGPV